MEDMIDKPDGFDTIYDFGDGTESTTADPAFEAWIRRVASAINSPGAVPSADMWAAISAAQSAGSTQRRDVLPLPARRTWQRPAGLAAALAATLLLGVALDRLVILRGDRAAATRTAGSTTSQRPPAATRSTESGSSDALYRLAAVQTLSQAEALLTAYRANDGLVRDSIAARTLGGWAREVLGSTRLLMDSPAGADPQIRFLLDDIELVLVQIVRLSGTPLDSTDRALIDDALRDRDLLPRIRTVVPAGADPGTASDN
jgi:hypothetical protein